MVDEVKIFVKIYEEKLVRFRQSITVGSLVEINNVRQYFSNEMNFIFRSEYRFECYKVTPKNDDFDLKFDTELSFKQRLRIVNCKEQMQPTILSKLSPMHLVRQTLSVVSAHSAHRRLGVGAHARADHEVLRLQKQI